jgi:NADP-dependent 3-hydroxy acid dehydrogenase YdfG
MSAPSAVADAPAAAAHASAHASANANANANAAPPSPFVSPGLAALRGRVALVTGASSGIGRACAAALYRAGMRVAAVARREDRLLALGEELRREEEEEAGAGGGEHAAAAADTIASPAPRFLPVVCDVSDEASVRAVFPRIREFWGAADQGEGGGAPGAAAGVDALVHVAGLARDDAAIFGGSASSWREMVDVNLLGTCLLFRETVADMQARGRWGTVVSMTGLTSLRCPDPQAGGSFFAATKMAMRMVTEGLRREARERGVPLRVCAVSPGLVETEFFDVRGRGRDPAALGRALSALPGPPLSPDDVARCVLFCLSAPEDVEVNDVVVRPRAQAI